MTTIFQIQIASDVEPLPFWDLPSYETSSMVPARALANQQGNIRYRNVLHSLSNFGGVVEFELVSELNRAIDTAVNVKFNVTYNDIGWLVENSTLKTGTDEQKAQSLLEESIKSVLDNEFVQNQQVIAEVDQLVYPNLTTEKTKTIQTQEITAAAVTPGVTVTIVTPTDS